MDIKMPIFDGDEFLYYLSCDFFEPPEGITNKFKLKLVLQVLDNLNKKEGKNYRTNLEEVEITPNKDYSVQLQQIKERLKNE